MNRVWIKLYLEILDDDKFGLLPEYLKWRAIELFLVAGENGDDGLLPPVARLAWRLRLEEAKIAETLSALTQVGVVNETPEGWKVTNFKKRQYSESYERVKKYREEHPKKRYRNVTCNEEVTAEVSSSTSLNLNSLKEDSDKIPETPAEAAENPDIVIYQETCGRIPGSSQYKTVIETVRFIRDKRNLTWETTVSYLMPYWLAWSSRKRKDGKPYDPSNLTWLTEWAVNGTIPSVYSDSKPEPSNPIEWRQEREARSFERLAELEKNAHKSI